MSAQILIKFVSRSNAIFLSCSNADKVNQMSHGESNSTTIGQLRARRKASKMLVAVVIIFAACYFPVHALNIVRYTYTDLNQSEIITVLSLLSHWLCYANSAVNPLIYNFMSGESDDDFVFNGRRLKCEIQNSQENSVENSEMSSSVGIVCI